MKRDFYLYIHIIIWIIGLIIRPSCSSAYEVVLLIVYFVLMIYALITSINELILYNYKSDLLPLYKIKYQNIIESIEAESLDNVIVINCQ